MRGQMSKSVYLGLLVALSQYPKILLTTESVPVAAAGALSRLESVRAVRSRPYRYGHIHGSYCKIWIWDDECSLISGLSLYF